MERMRKWVRGVMLRYYVERGEVLSFMQLQDILIRKGFSYYVSERDGRRRLRIRRAIYPVYRSVRSRIRELKRRRDIAMDILMRLIEYGDEVMYRRVYKEYKEYLTEGDREYLRKVRKERKGKS